MAGRPVAEEATTSIDRSTFAFGNPHQGVREAVSLRGVHVAWDDERLRPKCGGDTEVREHPPGCGGAEPADQRTCLWNGADERRLASLYLLLAVPPTRLLWSV